MFPILGALSIGMGALQMGMGLLDRRKAKKERKAAQAFFEENKYAIPEGAKASLGTAERLASGAMLPAQDLMEDRLSQRTAQGVGAIQGAATSAADVQRGLASLYGQEMMGVQDIGMQAAQRFDENQRQLQRAQEMYGQYEDIEWQQNVLAPYQQRMNTAAQYSQRGAQGLSAGLSGIAGGLSGMAQMKGAENRFGQYMDYLQGGMPSQPVASVKAMENRWMAANPANTGRTQLLPMPFTHPR